MKNIKLIIYDVNGTIFDDTAPFFQAINRIFIEFGKPKLPLDILKQKFSQPWYKIYRDHGITEAIASEEALYTLYNKFYIEELSRSEMKPFVDLEPTLKWLQNRGVTLAIISTQQNSITKPLLEKFSLIDYFSELVGGVSDKTKAIKDLVKKFGFDFDEAGYVGNQIDDIDYAKKAGVMAIAFCGGIHELERLANVNPDLLIHKHSDLKGLLFV